jgi:acylphosphatase
MWRGKSVRSLRAIVTGRVQGVGYRAWVEREATRRGLSGWVRNRREGSVEAVFSGEADAVAAMVAACKNGPRLAQVDEVRIEDMPALRQAGFSVLPTE